MIARVWKGWTTPGNADNYENLLKEEIFPGFTDIDGYRGSTIYRKDINEGEEIEFMITSFFDSLAAVKSFAGQEDYDIAVIEPEARELLLRVESHVKHYEMKEAFLIKDIFDK